jgi:AraC-like DNA-binding protein
MGTWIVLYAIGAAQAAMLAPALWRRPANAAANRVLAAWLALVAFDLAIKAAYMATGDVSLAPAFRVLRLLPFAYAPLFFLYVRTLVTGRAPRWRDLVHATGLLLMLAWMAWRWLSGAALSASDDWALAWFDPVLFSFALAYLAAGVHQIQRYQRWLRQRRSDADRLPLRWLVAMAACQCVIWGIAALHAVAELPGVDDRLIYAAVAGWVCLVGWFSLGQPPLAEPLPAMPWHSDAADAAAPGRASAAVAGEDPRYGDVEARLGALMDGQALYRDPVLGIARLAQRSGYPEYLVSEVINRRLGGNFYDYVNRHRIAAVRERLADPAESRSILELAYDAGFTSKSTFNTAFKRLAGETPSAFRTRHARSADGPPAPAGAGPTTTASRRRAPD